MLLTTFYLVAVDAQELYSDPIFGDRIDLGLIVYGPIDEASGIAASRKNPGVLWTHNDSGDPSRVFAFNTHGEHLGVYYIDGAGSRDWEDMAVGPGPDSTKQYLYIGDIGDNQGQHELNYIYRVPEPDVDSSQSPIDTTLLGTDIITFKYPDGSRDAETVMVDPITKDIYVVSKRESNVRVYLAAYPQSTTDTLTLEHKATLDSAWIAGGDFPLVTGGDISPSGLEILIKTYHKILYWQREPGQAVWEALANEPLIVPYKEEPQGEAVGWEPKELGGYYTISEEFNGIPAHLYFYPRLDPPVFVDDDRELHMGYSLNQNYPNPFNPSTTITYQVPENSFVSIKVYDLLGKEVASLVNEEKSAGNYELRFDASKLSSGFYLYTMKAGNFVETKKMLLMK
jgi:hypothetical protein